MKFTDHPAHIYALQVVSGKTLACTYIKMSCNRYLDDLKNGPKKGFHFNAEYAVHAINFCHRFIRHSVGEWIGQPFVLEPWQQFQLWNLFGFRWKSADGPRRFRTSYTEIPRKNGKTTLSAFINLYCTFAENEAKAEGYFAATKREQASIGFEESKRMIRQSPELRKHLKILTGSIVRHGIDQSIKALSADKDSMDGLNLHCGVIDELHAHKTDEVVNVLRTATGSRRQPLIYEITTAGTNLQGVCFDHRKYSIQILEGKLQDERWFSMIYTLDQDDDWQNPDVWIKANPNLGISKKPEYLKTMVTEAINKPATQSSIKRLDFNLWEGVKERWLPEQIWLKNKMEALPTDQDLVEHFESVAGLDVAAVRDFNALAMLFWNEDDLFAKSQFWVPAEMIDERVKKYNIGFDQWVMNGWIRQTTGNVADTNFILDEVHAYHLKYKFNQVAFDKAMAYHGLMQGLMERGIEGLEHPQSIMYMSEPTKEIERLLISKELKTDGSPVMDWMLGNVDLYVDPNANYKMNKGKSVDKIDGPVALAMAISAMMQSGAMNYKKIDPYNDSTEFF